MDVILVAALLAIVSLIYATIGQAGGTAFLAVFAIAGLPAGEIRPAALALNVAAAAYATWQLHRQGAVDWGFAGRLCLPSLPAALIGGLVVLEDRSYLVLTGVVLLAAAALTVLRGPAGPRKPSGLAPVLLAGTGLGLLSGLTGIGGGIFLSPLLMGLGWASAKQAATLSPPFILANSIFGLAGVVAAGQTPPADLAFYLPAILIGAAAGLAIGQRFLSEMMIRSLLALVLAAAGLRLIFV